MKLPDLKIGGRSVGGRKTSDGRPGGRLEAPKFFGDLYADLRDRRLLPLVALLVVAIAAVPFLLGDRGGEGEPFVAPPIEAAAPSSRADFSVVPAASSLREPRKRFGYRSQRDPFDGAKGGAGASTGTSKSTTPKPSRQTEASETSEPTEAGSGELAPTTEPTYEPQITETHITKKADVTVRAEFTGVGVNAKLGFVKHLKDQEKIRPMTKLPNAKHPVVVYMGPTQDDKGALFLMTSDVTAFYGGGRCAIAGQVCSLLELKPGQSATFDYGYGESRYKIQLKKLVALVKKVEVHKHFSSAGE